VQCSTPVPAILLAVDYLLEQPYIDANRLELAGVSLGAFLVSPAAVLDERIRRVWIVHGAGNPAQVIEYELRDNVRAPPTAPNACLADHIPGRGSVPRARALGRPHLAASGHRDQRHG
jgi:dienelactone hydrolase